MNRRTNAPNLNLKKIENGICGLSFFTAKEMEGLLLQISLAIGAEQSGKLSKPMVQKLQKCFYYFFAVERNRNKKSHTVDDIEVIYTRS